MVSWLDGVKGFKGGCVTCTLVLILLHLLHLKAKKEMLCLFFVYTKSEFGFILPKKMYLRLFIVQVYLHILLSVFYC